jgi:uncharacterized protein (TIGR03083 family)
LGYKSLENMTNFVPVGRLDTLPLFDELETLLVEFMAGLSADDWERPTLAGAWRVKDIAAHLLDGQLRGLSMGRDGYFGETPGSIDSYGELVAFLNKLNADWVTAMRRVSPAMLTAMLAMTGPAYRAYLQTLAPDDPALFSVAWAGEHTSPNWFHIAREYTEQWHHQQQMRWAIGQTAPLYTPRLYNPYLDTSMRALPHHYRQVAATPGASIAIEVTGKGGGHWLLLRRQEGWQLGQASDANPDAKAILPEDLAWRLLTKGAGREEVSRRMQTNGPARLLEPLWSLTAVMG